MPPFLERKSRSPIDPLTAISVLFPATAHASIFQSETLDAAANVLSWVVLVVVPVVGILIFWILHIRPEKIAKRRRLPVEPGNQFRF